MSNSVEVSRPERVEVGQRWRDLGGEYTVMSVEGGQFSFRRDTGHRKGELFAPVPLHHLNTERETFLGYAPGFGPALETPREPPVEVGQVFDGALTGYVYVVAAVDEERITWKGGTTDLIASVIRPNSNYIPRAPRPPAAAPAACGPWADNNLGVAPDFACCICEMRADAHPGYRAPRPPAAATPMGGRDFTVDGECGLCGCLPNLPCICAEASTSHQHNVAAAPVVVPAGPPPSQHDFSDPYAVVVTRAGGTKEVTRVCRHCGAEKDKGACKPTMWKSDDERMSAQLTETLNREHAEKARPLFPATDPPAPFRQSHTLLAGGVFSLRDETALGQNVAALRKR